MKKIVKSVLKVYNLIKSLYYMKFTSLEMCDRGRLEACKPEALKPVSLEACKPRGEARACEGLTCMLGSLEGWRLGGLRLVSLVAWLNRLVSFGATINGLVS